MMKLMSLTARRELLAGVRKKYRGACWADKVKILDGFVAATDYERKYATRLLNSTETPVLPEKHPTAQKYDEQVRQALLSVWHAANQICSKRLVPFLPQLVTAMEHHGHLRLPDGVRARLLRIPFGGATEGYAVGTPVVARATGGLVQQVVPYPSVALNAAVRTLSDQFHRQSDAPTGFLFRESGLGVKEAAQGWSAILDCAYWPGGDRLQERMQIPLFRSMVQAAEGALRHAIELYQTDQTGYAQMINQGFHMLDRFSWDQAVREYQEIFSSLPSA